MIWPFDYWPSAIPGICGWPISEPPDLSVCRLDYSHFFAYWSTVGLRRLVCPLVNSRVLADWSTAGFRHLAIDPLPEFYRLVYRRILMFKYWSTAGYCCLPSGLHFAVSRVVYILPVGLPPDLAVCRLACRRILPFAYWSTAGFCRLPLAGRSNAGFFVCLSAYRWISPFPYWPGTSGLAPAPRP